MLERIESGMTTVRDAEILRAWRNGALAGLILIATLAVVKKLAKMRATPICGG